MPPTPITPNISYTVPCIYAVDVCADGIGDIKHDFDLLAAARSEQLNNSYYFIRVQFDPNKGPDERQKREAIINDLLANLDPSHPLKKNKDIVIVQYTSKPFEGDVSEADKLNWSGVIGKPCAIMCISSSLYLSDRIATLFEIPTYESKLFLEHGAGAERMGFSPTQQGIFITPQQIHDDKDSEQLISVLNQKLNLNLDQNTALMILYSHVGILQNIQHICELKLNSPLGRDKKLVLFSSKAIILDDATTKLLASSNCEVRCAEAGQWVHDSTFRLLKSFEAKTSPFSIASGDKSAEACFANGFFPLIEFKVSMKSSFWMGFIEYLKNLRDNRFEEFGQYKQELETIITYLESSVHFCETLMRFENAKDDNAIKDAKDELHTADIRLRQDINSLDAPCFDVWHKICQYATEDKDITTKIPTILQIFRDTTELRFNPGQAEKNITHSIKTMPEDEYNKLVKMLIENINSHDDFTDRVEALFGNDGKLLSTYLSIRQSTLHDTASNEVLDIYQKLLKFDVNAVRNVLDKLSGIHSNQSPLHQSYLQILPLLEKLKESNIGRIYVKDESLHTRLAY